jgi:hypothetical protein
LIVKKLTSFGNDQITWQASYLDIITTSTFAEATADKSSSATVRKTTSLRQATAGKAKATGG